MWMFRMPINTYVRENIELARSVCSGDKQLDDANRNANRKLTARMIEDGEQLCGLF
jgi:phosphate uptake regulator